MLSGQTNVPVEFALTAAVAHADIFNDAEVDVVFTAPSGEERRVPAFWAGGDVFRVRYASAEPGRHTYRSVCNRPEDTGLHGRTGELELAPYAGGLDLYTHGHLRVAESGRTLEHEDGTPFFWLGDTWWFGLSKRLDWPQGMRALTTDRVDKGFTLIQIVTGPLPDIDAEDNPWDPQQENEAGQSWERGWTRMNPRYYDMADLRIAYLVESGLVPCIFGMWGYNLPFMGKERVKKHWRYLVARYGAYPVVWCVAGEVALQTYSHHPQGPERRAAEVTELLEGWTEIAVYLREIDPYRHPVCAHPDGGSIKGARSGRAILLDDAVSDIDMLQPGHTGYMALDIAIELVTAAVARRPRKPAVIGETNYEGMLGGSWQEIQRFLFWTSMSLGSAGHTYGAQGIWQMSSRYAPHRGYTGSWGEGFWQDVMHLPGSAQVGLGRRFFERYPWWLMEPREEPTLPEGRVSAFATGIAASLAVYYIAAECMEDRFRGIDRVGRYGITRSPSLGKVTIEPGATYRAYYFDPRSGAELDLGPVEAGDEGTWDVPPKPSMEDWVLVLEDKDALGKIAGDG